MTEPHSVALAHKPALRFQLAVVDASANRPDPAPAELRRFQSERLSLSELLWADSAHLSRGVCGL
jgi:hypothetical protein